MSPQKRIYGIDLLKCIAIIGVIIIHACYYGYELGSFHWLSSVFWGSIVRASVPIFFMCSGALFLGRGEPFSMKKLFTRTLPRIIIALFLWAFVYKLYRLGISGSLNGASLFHAFKEVLLFNHENHFYYLHITIILYLLMPLAELIAAKASRRLLEYLLLFWFVFAILYPSVSGLWPFSLLFGIPKQYAVNMTYGSVGYALLGYYIKAYPPRKLISALSASLGFIIVFGGTVLFSMRNGSLYEGFLSGMSPGVCLLGAGIFGLFCGVERPSAPFGKGVEYVSKASFCIYLSHLIILWEITGLGFTARLLPALICTPLRAICCAAAGTALYFILSHIPIIKKWLI